MFNNGLILLSSEDKYDARKAHKLLTYVEDINPNFKNTRELIKNAHLKGIDHVIINLLHQPRSKQQNDGRQDIHRSPH